MATKTYFKWRVGRSIVIMPSYLEPSQDCKREGNVVVVKKVKKLGKATEKEYQNYLKRSK